MIVVTLHYIEIKKYLIKSHLPKSTFIEYYYAQNGLKQMRGGGWQEISSHFKKNPKYKHVNTLHCTCIYIKIFFSPRNCQLQITLIRMTLMLTININTVDGYIKKLGKYIFF